MTFTGTPNLLVRLNPPIGNIQYIRFNAEGKFTTDNPRVIKRLGNKFETILAFTCKKCDFSTNTKPDLMKHYRQSHPKEESK